MESNNMFNKGYKTDVSQMLKQLNDMGLGENVVPAEKGAVYRPANNQTPASDYQKPAEVAGGFPSLYPMSYMGAQQVEELGPKDPTKAEETFVDGIGKGVYDPELNQMALEHVAESQGITVEELLRTKGKRMDQAVQAAPGNAPVEKFAEMSQKIAEMQAKLNEALALQEQMQNTPAPAPAPKKPAPTPVMTKLHATTKDVLHPKVKNPILAKIRQTLAIESIKPEEVTIQGLRFELLPPPGSLQPWIIQKVSNTMEAFGGDERITETVLKNVTFAATVVRIDGSPTAEALGLVPEGTIRNIHQLPAEVAELTAQALWEMATGTSSVDLPSLPAEVISKVFTAYGKRFRENMFTSSIDPALHRYVCNVEGCGEFMDREPAGTNYFCSIHGTPLQDLGPLAELKSSPLA